MAYRLALRLLLGLSLVLFVLPSISFGDVPIPELTGPFTDFTGKVSEHARIEIESKLKDFQARRGPQVAVVVLDTVGEESIEAYALKVAERSRLGRVGEDDWALIVVALTDKKLRVEVGYGLEGVLTDYQAFAIADQSMRPQLREGNVDGALISGVNEVIRTLESEDFKAPQRQETEKSPYLPIILGVVLGTILAAIFGRLPGASIGGLIAFFVGIALVPFVYAAGAGIVSFFLVLIDFVGGFMQQGGRSPRVIFGGGGFGHSSGGSYGLGSGRGGGGGATVGW